MSLASISSTVQGLFGSRGRSRSHRGSLGGEEDEDVALLLAGNSSAIPATFSDSFHYSTPCRLFRFFFFCFFLCFSPPTWIDPFRNRGGSHETSVPAILRPSPAVIQILQHPKPKFGSQKLLFKIWLNFWLSNSSSEHLKFHLS